MIWLTNIKREGFDCITFSDGREIELALLFPDIIKADGLPFLKIGSNAGVTQSNTLFSELYFYMSGLLIEANPVAYDT